MRRKYTDKLLYWKKDNAGKPLLLQGGRQTGKTWLLREFGSRQYEDTVYINLETDRPVREYLSVPREAEEALLFIEAYANKPVHKESTLLILDSIQCIPNAGRLLSAMAMDFPGYRIAAAERGISGVYDSGDVEVLRLTALDFEEFLWANKEYALAKEIKEHFESRLPMGKKLHEKAMAQLRLYLAIGGMPEAICEYRKEKKLLMVPDIQKKLLNLLQSDIVSGTPESISRHCRNCWLSIPSQLCRENVKFQYGQVVKGGTAKIYEEPLRWLIKNGLAYISCKKSGAGGETDETSFRLYLTDNGLSACQSGIPSYVLLSGEDSSIARSIAENYLAQTFVQSGYRLSYWSSGNQAAVPFLLEKDGKSVAADFRMTPHQKVRNLARLKESFQADKLFLLSAEDFRSREAYDIVPLYAAFCV